MKAPRLSAEGCRSLLEQHGNRLTEAQRWILRMLAEGRTQAEIGRELGLTRSGVWHRVKDLRKLLETPTERPA